MTTLAALMVALVASAAGSIRHSNSIKGDALPFSVLHGLEGHPGTVVPETQS